MIPKRLIKSMSVIFTALAERTWKITEILKKIKLTISCWCFTYLITRMQEGAALVYVLHLTNRLFEISKYS